MARPRSGQVYFGVDARHIRQLGQELVGDRVTAVTELVKNAYDADATLVSVRFSAEDGVRELTITDDGHGMRFEDLERGWMRISTPDKDENPVSPLYKRTRSGRKGIGRFATETLGESLELQSSVRGEPLRLAVRFDWSGFAAGADLSSVGSNYRVEPAAKSAHGTTLVIRGLHHDWTEDDLADINDALLLLQPPFPVARVAGRRRHDPGFRVDLAVGEDDIAGAVSGYDEFIDAATARVWITVNRRSATLCVRAAMFDLDETLPLDYPRWVGPFEAEAAYFVYRAEALGSIKVRAAQAMGREYGGIRLYRDGLRVMPYGEPGVDWLDLEKLQGSRSSTLAPIRHINWFGQVLIGREPNAELIDTASREGLVQNRAYRELRRVLQDGLVRAAERVASARGRKGRTDTKADPSSRKEVLSDAERAVMEKVLSELPPALAKRVSGVVQEAFRAVGRDASAADSAEREYLASLVGEIELMRVLASLGTSIAVFNHEVQSVLNGASAAYASLSDDLATRRVPAATRAKLDSAGESLERLGDLATYINAYVSVSQRREREPQPLHAVVEAFVTQLSGTLARGVSIDWNVTPRILRTEPMTRSELETVLINFLTNAIKAMNKEGLHERRIGISATARGGRAVLRFQDTGIGIDPSIAEDIFEPFVSDTRSSVTALGIGTGLGLKIVSDIAEAYEGTVQIGQPDDGYTTCFEFSVPRWKRQVKT